MVAKNTQFATVLQQHGHSVTKPRQAVFAALEGSDPLTMAQLIEQLPRIDRATIYRVIELFEELGVVKRIPQGWKYKLELSDMFNHHHHHLSCIKCGRIVTVPEDTDIEATIHALGDQHSFKIIDHQLEIQGICEDCQKQ